MPDEKEIREQILEYENEIARDPKSDAYFPLAELYMQLSESRKACEICVYGLKYHPDFYEGYIILGNILLSLEKFDRAEKAFATAFKMNPSKSEPLFDLCHVYEKMGDLHKLQGVLHQLEIIAPYDARVNDIRKTVSKIRQDIKNTKENLNKPQETAKIVNNPVARQKPVTSTPKQSTSNRVPATQKVVTQSNPNEIKEVKKAPVKPIVKKKRQRVTKDLIIPKEFNFDNFIEDLFKIEGISGIVFMNETGQISRSMDFDINIAKALAKILRSYAKAFNISFGVLKYGEWQECTIDIEGGTIFLLNLQEYKLAFYLMPSLKLGNFRAKMRSILDKHNLVINRPV